MTLSRSVSEILQEHVIFEMEMIGLWTSPLPRSGTEHFKGTVGRDRKGEMGQSVFGGEG